MTTSGNHQKKSGCQRSATGCRYSVTVALDSYMSQSDVSFSLHLLNNEINAAFSVLFMSVKDKIKYKNIYVTYEQA